MLGATMIRVLVADDDELLRRVYRRVLLGMDVRCVRDGQEALDALISGFDADVIVSDYDMGPGRIDGLSLCRAVRSMGLATPLVLVSGTAGLGQRAVDSGASAVLGKPFDGRQLRQLIERLAEGSAP